VVELDHPVSFEGDRRDPGLEDALRAELAGILKYMVDGAVAYYHEGLQIPDSVRVATADYREQTDPLGDYLLERIEEGSEYEIQAGAVYKDYVGWCDNSQMRDRERLSMRRFGELMGGRFTKEKRKSASFYVGIRTKTPPVVGGGGSKGRSRDFSLYPPRKENFQEEPPHPPPPTTDREEVRAAAAEGGLEWTA
jgi:phage/plasmid-associated DNA primase